MDIEIQSILQYDEYIHVIHSVHDVSTHGESDDNGHEFTTMCLLDNNFIDNR